MTTFKCIFNDGSSRHIFVRDSLFERRGPVLPAYDGNLARETWGQPSCIEKPAPVERKNNGSLFYLPLKLPK
jgi:hypothetical protein